MDEFASGPLHAVVDEQRQKAVLMTPSEADGAIIFDQLEAKSAESDDVAASYNVSGDDRKSNGITESSSSSSSSSGSNNLVVYPTGGTLFQTFGGGSVRNYKQLFAPSFTQAESEKYLRIRKAKLRNDQRKEKHVSKSFVVQGQHTLYSVDDVVAQLGETDNKHKALKKSNSNGVKMKPVKLAIEGNGSKHVENGKHVENNKPRLSDKTKPTKTAEVAKNQVSSREAYLNEKQSVDKAQLVSLDSILDEAFGSLNRASSKSTESLNGSFVKVTNRKWKKRMNHANEDTSSQQSRASSRPQDLHPRGSHLGRSATSSYRGSRESSVSRTSSSSVMNKECNKNDFRSDSQPQILPAATRSINNNDIVVSPEASSNMATALSASDFPPLEEPTSPKSQQPLVVDPNVSMSSAASTSSSSSEKNGSKITNHLKVWPKGKSDAVQEITEVKEETILPLMMPASSMPDVCVATDTSRRDESLETMPVTSSLPDVAAQASSVPPILASPPSGHQCDVGDPKLEPAVIIFGEETGVEGLFEFGFDINQALLSDQPLPETVEEPHTTTPNTMEPQTTTPNTMEPISVSFGAVDEQSALSMSSTTRTWSMTTNSTSTASTTTSMTSTSSTGSLVVEDVRLLQVISYVAGLWLQVEKDLKAKKPSVVVYEAAGSG